MSYQVLARKWRPRSFGDMVGQGHALRALTNALDSGRLHHAYLFTGTRGVGKTTLARIVAKCLNCEKGVGSTPCGECSACTGIDEGRFVDLIEVDAASKSKVDETRDLMENVQYTPTYGRFKVYLIDEVHMFSDHSFNALLKTLEEPPPHVKFLLATTAPRKLPVTILSRCLQFNLKHLTVDQIANQIGKVLENEGIDADEDSKRLIAIAAQGSMRDALSLLDQAIAYGDGRLEQGQVREMLGTIDASEITGLLSLLAENRPADLLALTARIAEYNPDYDAILAEMLARLHDVAMAQAMDAEGAGFDDVTRELAGSMPGEDVQLYYQIGLNGRRDLTLSPDPRTGFEMTLIRMLAFRPAGDGGTAERAGTRHARSRPAPAVATATAESEGGDAMPKDWQMIIDEMALAGLVKELAGHCVLKEHTDRKVHLVLSPSQEHLLKTTQKDRLHEALKVRFGPDIRLEISVQSPDAETPAQRQNREEEERRAAAKASMESDPNVHKVLEMFDATLDKESIQPRRTSETGR